MILSVLAFRNKKMQCFTNPFYSQEKLENMETNFGRAMVQDRSLVAKYKNLALYNFGTFDDKTGLYELKKEPELMFDCDDIIAVLPEE